jgi:O-antigen/teichoic acid export membrane protein
MLLVAQNYIWCAEKTKWSAVPLAVGLAVNFGLNVVLVPAWGLLGAVISTTAATGIATAVLYWMNTIAGMQLDRGMIWLTVTPIALCGGPWIASAVLAIVLVALPFSLTLVSAQERVLVAQFYRDSMTRFAPFWVGRTKTVEARHAT